MASFVVRIDKLEIHDHSPTAHRVFIKQALDQVKQAIGDGTSTEGDIVGAGAKIVGSWKLHEGGVSRLPRPWETSKEGAA